jgi:uracil-DNA glycosylase family 4
MDREKAIIKIHSRHERICTCALRKTATRAVWGSGNTNANIVFIGEAPGKNEDQQGIPFVGSAGKFLSEMLASIGLKREDVYITNIVKYRPPNNRDPLPQEKTACKEWLRDEIALINPQLIIPLGRHALAYFLPDARISEVHGQLFVQTFSDFGIRSIVPLYHPAAALYNGSLRITLKEDFLKIPGIIKSLKETAGEE